MDSAWFNSELFLDWKIMRLFLIHNLRFNYFLQRWKVGKLTLFYLNLVNLTRRLILYFQPHLWIRILCLFDLFALISLWWLLILFVHLGNSVLINHFLFLRLILWAKNNISNSAWVRFLFYLFSYERFIIPKVTFSRLL